MEDTTAIEKRLSSDMYPVCETNKRNIPALLCVACCQISHTGMYDPNRPISDCDGSCDRAFREMVVKHVFIRGSLKGFNPSNFL